MRLLPGEECARVYSYLGLDRACRATVLGMGMGMGLERGGFTPMQIPGCQLWCETDTSAHPTAVVFPADPVVNGTFAADATWTKGADWTINGGVAKHAAVGANDLSQACLVVGNTYTITYTVTAQTAGNITLKAGTTAGTARTAPGTYTETLLCAGNTSLIFTGDAACDAWIDNVLVSPRNVSQLTDLTGLGNHLVQATATTQPLWVASGSGGYLSPDTVDLMTFAAPWAQNNPCTVYALIRRPVITDVSRYLLYGSSSTACRITTSDNGAGAGNKSYAMSNDCFPNTTFEETAWHILRGRFNTTTAGLRIDSNAEVTAAGTPTFANWVSLGRAANQWSTNTASLVIINQNIGAADDARITRYLTRLGKRLVVL